MKAYKGFNEKLQCNPNGEPFQYEIGKEYEHEGDVKPCSRGFHACTSPLGEYGAATAGNSGAATAGNRGAATAGEYGAATSKGKSSTGDYGLSVARGNGVKVKGGLNAVLVIAEENNWDCEIKDWKAVVVDGEKIKADTWYKLENGELVEVKE